MVKLKKVISSKKIVNKKIGKSTKVTHHVSDEGYFLKLVLFLILSSIWLRIKTDTGELPLPIGAFIALPYAFHEHFQIDRKIELALILVGMFISFWLPIGIYVSL